MKKYLALLLTLALVVTVSVMAVNAATEDIDFSAGDTVDAVCPHCGGDSKVQWLPLTQELATSWANNYPNDTSNHYYICDDQISLGKALTIGKGETMCLHLNGKTWTRPGGARAFSIDGTPQSDGPCSQRSIAIGNPIWNEAFYD